MFGIQHSPFSMLNVPCIHTRIFLFLNSVTEDRSIEKIKKGKKEKQSTHRIELCNSEILLFAYMRIDISHISHRPHSTINSVNINNKCSLFILWEPTISWHNTKYFDQNHHNKGIHRALNQISMIIVPLKLFALLQVLLIGQTMENVYNVEHGKMVGKNSWGEGELTIFFQRQMNIWRIPNWEMRTFTIHKHKYTYTSGRRVFMWWSYFWPFGLVTEWINFQWENDPNQQQ